MEQEENISIEATAQETEDQDKATRADAGLNQEENERNDAFGDEPDCVSQDGSSLVESVNQPSEKGQDEDLESDLAVSLVVDELLLNTEKISSNQDVKELQDSRTRKQ